MSHTATIKIALLIVVFGILTGFIFGIIFQRQIGIGNLLKRLGLNHNQLIHTELSARFQSLRNKPIPKGSIVFVGDSLIDLQEWNEVFPGFNVINRGVSGATIEDLCGAFEYDGTRAVFCLIGANDIGRGTSTRDFKKKFERLLNSVDENDNFHVIAIPPFFSYGGVPIRQGVIDEYNEIIRELSASKGYKFIHTGSSNDWQRDDFECDGLHLNIKGYDKLINYLNPHIAIANNK